MTIREARGPVVAALKRYDPGLRVRWSPEKQRWAVDAPFKLAPLEWCVPPVRFVETSQGRRRARLLPENSEAYIQYHSKRYVVCWVKRLDMRLVRAVIERDSHRHAGGLAQAFDRKDAENRTAQEQAAGKLKQERVYEAFDRVKYFARKNPNAEDGTGVSVKGAFK